jgi:hypothetical protein
MINPSNEAANRKISSNQVDDLCDLSNSVVGAA